MLLVLACYAFIPAIVIWACQRFSWLNAIGAVVLCYVAGIVIAQVVANSTLAPEQTKQWQESLMGVLIVISLPLILLSTHIRQWLLLGPVTLKALFTSVLSVLIMSFIAGLLFVDQEQQAWQITGLLSGLYIGGTPNLAAIKEALHADNLLFLQIHSYDTVLTLFYILFLVSFSQRILAMFLVPFDNSLLPETSNPQDHHQEGIHNYAQLLRPQYWRGLAVALALAMIIVVVITLLSNCFFGNDNMAFIMVGLTVLSLLASLVPTLRNIAFSFELGMYGVLSFCVVVGSMITPDLFQELNVTLAAMILLVVFGSLLLHLLLCRLFRIDTDTAIITSAATICSPPFIPMVALALNNRAILLSGIAVGVAGYALGTVLGIGAAYLFQFWFILP